MRSGLCNVWGPNLSANFSTAYLIKFNDVVRYVGITKNSLSSRISDHYYEAFKRKSNLLVHKAMRDSKSKIEFEAFCSTKDHLHALDLETKLISDFKTHHSFGGLNYTYGGSGFRAQHTSESKLKNSKSKNEYYKNNHGPNHGKSFSKEYRFKLREAKRSKFKAVLCLSDGITYESVSHAAREIGISKSIISMVCLGKRPHARGMRFKYIRNQDSSLEIKKVGG